MSSFTGSLGDESRLTSANRPLDDDGYTAYDPRLPSQRFDSFTDFFKNSGGNSSPIFTSQQSYVASDEAFSPQTMSGTPPSTYSTRGGRYSFSPKRDGDGGFGLSEGPMILPPEPAEMQTEEGFALREWRRKNAIRLEEKEKKEKEMLQLIIGEAEDYEKEFYRKRQLTLENKAAANREKEKLFIANQEKFHAEAEKNYWKAIAELIPHEAPVIEKRGKKKNEDKKKPSIVVIQGPKPGKPTDLLRMRQILVKLRHNPPAHMKPKPPPAAATAEAAPGASSANAEAASAPEVIAAA